MSAQGLLNETQRGSSQGEQVEIHKFGSRTKSSLLGSVFNKVHLSDHPLSHVIQSRLSSQKRRLPKKSYLSTGSVQDTQSGGSGGRQSSQHRLGRGC